MARKSKYEYLYAKSVRCHRCGANLTCKASIRRGYGRDCWEIITRQIVMGSLSEVYVEVQ